MFVVNSQLSYGHNTQDTKSFMSSYSFYRYSLKNLKVPVIKINLTYNKLLNNH